MNDEEYSKEMENRFKTIEMTIEEANKNGLLVEIVYHIAELNQGTIQEKCIDALMEWDC